MNEGMTLENVYTYFQVLLPDPLQLLVSAVPLPRQPAQRYYSMPSANNDGCDAHVYPV